MSTHKVSVIGSGNWGSVTAKIAAQNAIEHPDLFDQHVRMWVHEEQVNGKNLSEIINTEHENVKYLPGIKLPENLVAVTDIVEAAKGSDLLVFNVPHQFLVRLCKQLAEHIDELKKAAAPHPLRAISCIKGLDIKPEDRQVDIPCRLVCQHLSIPCGVLSGANLAPEIANEKFSETTIAYDEMDDKFNVEEKIQNDVALRLWKKLFHRPYFHVQTIYDTVGASLAGALKNVVALASGYVDGMNWGDNAKAAIMRRGLLEMVHFANVYFPDETSPETFMKESCGVADLITSCAGGRNHRVGKEFIIRKFINNDPSVTIEQVEADLLNGQSAQGVLTAREVYELVALGKRLSNFPLFVATYEIAFSNRDVKTLPLLLDSSPRGSL
ncbi:hypothetical protein CANCADRAFT_85019 [Tortispora caseinolytica NRRL Y-17796]|uniref:Glycerol-3-phosphate dehydrogenase [NAD(+)] n=1 Tax=Tortispora caseinolytica NRRL Y-17796 TaxID=767744 RepID=A0A1E4TKR2_9ASCO|nr:hypothetical protein CANCADRAFT_85019 [Tortispora caseinolytica NRRL Y-17796]